MLPRGMGTLQYAGAALWLTSVLAAQIKKHLPGTEEHKAHKANQGSGMNNMSGTGAGTNQY